MTVADGVPMGVDIGVESEHVTPHCTVAHEMKQATTDPIICHLTTTMQCHIAQQRCKRDDLLLPRKS